PTRKTLAIPMEEVYLNFIRRLNEENVKYLVIGGYAVIAHGYVRTTIDLDLLVATSEENARNIIRVLLENGFETEQFELRDFTQKPNFVSIRIGAHWIELMTETLGLNFEEAYANRLLTVFDGVTIPYLNLADLIRNKKAVGRLKDQVDLENLPEPE
ncbi:MAG: hypothetical protein LH606_20750, partial [Cytophagaceae bacterium]|nr:hypothetical protein [Cytophagaceae bacterium]